MRTLIREMKYIPVVFIGLLVGLLMMAPVYGESAPVYDADSSAQQSQLNMDPGPGIDDSTDQSQYLPPPPPPGQEMDGAIAAAPGQQPPQQLQPLQQQPSQPLPPPPQSPVTVVATNQSSPSLSMDHLSLDQRMNKLERQINNMANSDATNQVESLQNQVQSLRGQVEELTHQLQQMQDQQKNVYSDIDKRLSQLNENVVKQSVAAVALHPEVAVANDEGLSLAPVKSSPKTGLTTTAKKSSSVSVKAALAPKSGADQPNVEEEQQIYQTAYNQIKAKKYNEAVSALQNMLKKYPSGQFASNAHYWLGELYGLMGKNELALTEFKIVVNKYPDSPRVSDAQLKVGLVFASQLKWPDAKAALKRVINHYPGTASARLASEQLKQIRQAGH